MLGKKVRELRKSHHYTLAVLAAQVGISESYLSQLESGRIDPSVSLVRKLAAAFQVPIAAFFDAEYETPTVITREERSVISYEHGTVVLSRLSPEDDQVLMNLSEFLLAPGAVLEQEPLPFHTCLYVTQGTLRVLTLENEAELYEGDSIYLPIDTGYRLVNSDVRDCRGLLCVRENPKGGQ